MTTPIMGDGLPTPLLGMLGDEYQVFPWDTSEGSEALATCVGVITYGHPAVDGTLMDRMPHKQHRLNNGAALISPAMYATSPSSISARSSLHLLQTSEAMKQLSRTDPICTPTTFCGIST